MTLQEFAQLGGAIGGIGVISSFIYVAIQIRNNTKAVRAGTFQQLVASLVVQLDDLARNRDLCDLVLVMSVQAGFGGQSFNPVALDKLRQVRELVADDVLLEIDGGISPATISQASAAGAQLFVVGSAIFGKPDYQQAVTELTHLATPQPV